MSNIDRVWERYHGQVDGRYSQLACRARINWLCAQATGQRILDIGCSQGICEVILAREGRQVVGIDIETVAIESARSVLAHETDQVRQRVELVVGNAFTAAFERGSFDCVIIGELLEHLATPGQLLARIPEWLVPGGRLIVSVPLGYHPYPDHKRTFYLSNLLELLGEHFTPIAVETIEHSYVCAVALAPEAGKSPQGAPDEALRAWNRACELALERAQRELYEKWRRDRTVLSERLAAMKDKCKEQRGELQTCRKAVRERDQARSTNQQLTTQLRTAEKQLEMAARRGQQLEGAVAETTARWRKALEDQQQLRTSLQGAQRELAADLESLRSLRQAVERHRQREQVANARAEHLDQRVSSYKAQLDQRTQEVRYRLGDALVLALRPSKDTLRLPGRLLSLFREGLRRRRARRAVGASPGLPGQTMPRPAPAAGPASAVRPAHTAKAAQAVLREVTKPLTAVVRAEQHNGHALAPAPTAPTLGDEGTRPQDSRPGRRTGGYLFFCVNGAGLGHVTRSLAIARRIRRLDPEAPIYFLSSSQALDVISREGMVAYHIPPHSRYGDSLRTSEWSTLLQQQIELIANTHHPAVFVYDGVFPYRGVLDAIQGCTFVHTAMVLRLRHKHDRLQEMADKLSVFNEVIFPGEAGVAGGIEDLAPPELAALNCQLVEPIVYLDREELLPREQVRAQWNTPPDKKLVYLQLGAGNINDIQALTDRVLSVLIARQDVVVLLAQSPIAERAQSGRENVHVVRHYPNSLYCHGFDLAITAVGYNTFHEQIHFGVPSILLPNEETKTDDQVRRALTAHRALAAIAVLRPERLEEAIALGLTDAVAATMREKALALVPRNGALSAAQRLVAAAHPAPACAPA